MEFLRSDLRPKVLRTRLYGDQEFDRFELEILHTPLMQRLYNLKQLGFTDRVYPDAVHGRFNHVLGVTEVVRRMVSRIDAWLASHKAEVFVYATMQGGGGNPEKAITGEELRVHLNSRMRPLRLMALLHDVTHAAYGHTLEDEVNVFDEKHDNPARQSRFFNALTAQLLYLWSTEERLRDFDASVLEDLSRLKVSSDGKTEKKWAEELSEYLQPPERKALAERLRELELACRLLLQLDYVHNVKNGLGPPQENLILSDVAPVIDVSVPPLELVLNRDMFMVDLVGNTICADLLDYAHRDPDGAGLRVQFDDRFLRYLCVVSVRGGLAPTTAACIRTGIQIFTDKIRYDVLSEMSGILKARYVINERVVFHPTKCAAGAMLGTAVQLLGLRDLPFWMQVLGDQEFLRVVTDIARNLEALCGMLSVQAAMAKRPTWQDVIRTSWSADSDMAGVIRNAVEWIVPSAKNSENLSTAELDSLLKRARGARNVLGRLNSRRFPKMAYRLRTVHHTGGATDETIADEYCRPKDRYLLERKIEEVCNLPIGSVFVHCPRRMTSMKVAEALVVGDDLKQASQLRNVSAVSHEGLEPYEDEIRAVETMYRSIWQFHAFLDPAFWDKQPVVEWAFERELHFPNDELLIKELAGERQGPYHLVAGEFKDEIAPKWLPEVIRRVDAEQGMRMRQGEKDMRARLRSIIREVSTDANGDDGQEQLGLPGIGDKS